MKIAMYHEYGMFAAFAESLSYAKAASRLQLHPSNISRGIRRLEEELGFRLVKVDYSKLELTQAGHRLAKELVPMFKHLDSAIDVLSQAELGQHSIRILGPQEALTELVNPVIHSMSGAYPHLTFAMEATTHLPDPAEDDFDIFISHRRHEITKQNLIVSRLCRYAIALYCSPSVIEHYGMPQDIEELQEIPCLARPNEKGWKLIDTETREIHEAPLDVRVMATPQTVRMDLARSGYGITPASIKLCKPFVTSGELVRVLPNYCLEDGEFYLVQQSHHLVSPFVKTFAKELKQYAQSGKVFDQT